MSCFVTVLRIQTTTHTHTHTHPYTLVHHTCPPHTYTHTNAPTRPPTGFQNPWSFSDTHKEAFKEALVAVAPPDGPFYNVSQVTKVYAQNPDWRRLTQGDDGKYKYDDDGGGGGSGGGDDDDDARAVVPSAMDTSAANGATDTRRHLLSTTDDQGE